MDLISVIVPVYKVEAYLDQCVSSIVQQTYKALEIILVDDGSPDRCPQMCDQWAEEDGRIKVVHKKNGGLSDARNAGLEIASGDYIAFVDSDDWIHESFVDTLYRQIQDTGADICECAVIYASDDEKVLRVRACGQKKILYSRTEAIKALIREDGLYQTVWNKLYKRSVLDNIPFEIGKQHEDDFWTYRVFDRIGTLIADDQPLYYYRQRTDSIMSAGYQIKRLDGLEARIRRMEYLRKDRELLEYSNAYLQFDYLYHLQCILRYLNGRDRSKAVHYVLQKMERLGTPNYKGTAISVKYRFWFWAFRMHPVTIANIRNALKIGM